MQLLLHAAPYALYASLERFLARTPLCDTGFTVGFLLPVMKLFDHLWQKDGYIPAASAAVLVPSPHLAQQV